MTDTKSRSRCAIRTRIARRCEALSGSRESNCLPAILLSELHSPELVISSSPQQVSNNGAVLQQAEFMKKAQELAPKYRTELLKEAYIAEFE